jgi:riboflavin synthase
MVRGDTVLFTGLIEQVGGVCSSEAESGGVRRIGIRAPGLAREMKRGDSIAVAGACLTVAEIEGDVFYAQMMSETLCSTKLGDISAGGRVNLERPLRADGRLDGHIVLGHVDDVGHVTRIEDAGLSRKLWVSVSSGVSWGIAPKGSIAVDGVSLTVVNSLDGEFSVGLVPATLEATTLGALSPGEPVNIEIDAVARYIARMTGLVPQIDSPSPGKNSLNWEKLNEYGWS